MTTSWFYQNRNPNLSVWCYFWKCQLKSTAHASLTMAELECPTLRKWKSLEFFWFPLTYRKNEGILTLYFSSLCMWVDRLDHSTLGYSDCLISSMVPDTVNHNVYWSGSVRNNDASSVHVWMLFRCLTEYARSTTFLILVYLLHC